VTRKPLFSVTAKDFTIQTFRAGGKGGQNQNKVNSGVRLIHKASGARGEARDSRHQAQNKQAAFRRLLDTPKWKAWHKLEVAKRLGAVEKAEEAAQLAMSPENLRVEALSEQGWVPYESGNPEG
jgi:protein subunit release factor B